MSPETLPPQSSEQVSKEKLSRFYWQLSILLGTGFPIDKSLEFLSVAAEAKLCRALNQLLTSISEGQSLSEGMACQNQIFSPVAIALVRAGEESASLHHMVKRLSDLSEQSLRLKRNVISALTYPIVLCVSILLVAGLVATVMASQDEEFFRTNDLKLPLPNLILISIFKFIGDPISLVLMFVTGICLFGFLRGHLKANPNQSISIHRFILRIPMLGNILRNIGAARMCYVLGLSLESGIYLLPALKLAENMLGNKALAHSLRHASKEIENGTSVAKALTSQGFLPPIVASMLEVGEETGNLSELLLQCSDLLEEEANDALMASTRYIEPLLIAGSGVVATFVALGALAPMLELLRGV